MGIDVHLNILTSDRLAFAVVKAKGIMFQVYKCPHIQIFQCEKCCEQMISYVCMSVQGMTLCCLKVCLHVPTPSPPPSQCMSKFNIVLMVTGSLTGRMGDTSILPVKLPITISTMLNFDGHCDGDGDGVGTCKHTFKSAVKARLHQASASM